MSDSLIERAPPLALAAGAARRRRRLFPYLLIAPSVVLLVAVTIFPLFFALKNSFYFWNLQIGPEPLGFIGIGNYEMALTSSVFTASLVNTLTLTVSGTLLEVLVGLAIALLLCHALPGMSVARALLIMPTTIAPIVVGFLFRYMYDPTGGLIPWLLTAAGVPIPKVGLLGSGMTALPSILFADMWQWTPFCVIVLYAALLSVPHDVVEAALLDGASAWTMLRRIRLPLIRKTLAFVVMLRFMQLFNTFDLVLVLTRGGPGSSTRTLGYTLYQQGLVDFNIGLASAMTWIIVIMVNALIGLYVFFVFKDWE
jgi:multiple sugar transport system permease protein